MTKKEKAAWQKKCKDYARFLKDDYDFNWEYILHLLRYKLQRTRKVIENGLSADRKTIAKQIKAVEDLLWKVCEYSYHEEVFKPFYAKYGNPKMVTKKCKDRPGISSLHFLYKGAQATPAMDKQMRILYSREAAAQQDDIDKAFSLIAKNIRNWWD